MTSDDWLALEANPCVTISSSGSFLDAEDVSDQ